MSAVIRKYIYDPKNNLEISDRHHGATLGTVFHAESKITCNNFFIDFKGCSEKKLKIEARFLGKCQHFLIDLSSFGYKYSVNRYSTPSHIGWKHLECRITSETDVYTMIFRFSDNDLLLSHPSKKETIICKWV